MANIWRRYPSSRLTREAFTQPNTRAIANRFFEIPYVTSATITGVATATVIARAKSKSNTTISGSASVTGTARGKTVVNVSITGIATVTTTARGKATASGSISGVSIVSGGAKVLVTASGTITGTSIVIATGTAKGFGSGTINGQSSVSGTGEQRVQTGEVQYYQAKSLINTRFEGSTIMLPTRNYYSRVTKEASGVSPVITTKEYSTLIITEIINYESF